MKILGISLGHDSNFALVENGKLIGMMEAERFFRQKRYKLSAEHLEEGKFPSTYQYTDVEDLKMFLGLVKKEWGSHFDAVALQNQGRKEEFENCLTILRESGVIFETAHHINHHLSHAALSYFTSPFSESLVLSYDGIGNDGRTVFFSGLGNKLDYLANVPIAFGQSYNNLGYILGIKPEIDGSTAGKLMGLTSYGTVRESWVPKIQEYILKYKKLASLDLEELQQSGKGGQFSALYLEDIPDLAKYRTLRPIPKSLKDKVKLFLGLLPRYDLNLPGPKDRDSQDLAATLQHVWTDEVLKLLRKHRGNFKNICIVGGCALNGTTNYAVEKSELFKQVHLIPNPSDCGLSGGAALYAYYNLHNNNFSGLKEYYSPYLGSLPYDQDKIETLKEKYPHREIPDDVLPKTLATLISKDIIVGFIRGKYEIGPRALGNRSILCNPLNPKMRDILNDKVKHREWYRPFAPMVTEEDSQKYFTNTASVPYMSVICYTREEYHKKLPSITHVDGTARIQTINPHQNPFIYKSLKEFEKITGMPIFLNTSFNPAGEPILNFNEVALKMLDETDLDLVIVGNVVFSSHAKKHLLETL